MKDVTITVPDNIFWVQLMEQLQDNQVYIDPLEVMEFIKQKTWDKL